MRWKRVKMAPLIGSRVTPEEIVGSTQCGLCGRVQATRPWGDGGMRVCWECRRKNPEVEAMVEKNMNEWYGWV